MTTEDVAADGRKRREEERRTAREGAEIWRRRKEELLREKRREQLELREILANYSPWGRPGGGAPCPATLRKRNVPLEPPESPRSRDDGQGWTSGATIDRLAGRTLEPLPVADDDDDDDDGESRSDKTVAETERQEKPVARKPYSEEVQVYKLTGGVELVPLLMCRRHNSQPLTTRHLMTDATRPGYTIESLRALGIGNREYIAQLTEQIRRKRDRALEERRLEREHCRRHFDTWRRLWGRPGHGAPTDHARRGNLYDILHRPTPIY